MATNQILTKQSSENDIRRYFNAILELTKSDNEFPVNLDEVWMLVFPRKDHAVRELKENFIQNIDYQVFLKNGENPLGGRPTSEYFLTVPCLEFFIARKVRAVFEVYRQVFHRKITSLDSITRKDLARMLYESEVEKEQLQHTVRIQEKQIRDLRMRITQGENLPERVTQLEQLVIPGFNTQPANFTPSPQPPIVPPESRVKPSKAHTRYPGALLVYEVRARIQREKGIVLRSKDIFAWLNREGWILSSDFVHNMPSDKAINNGWMLPTWGTGRRDSNRSFYTPRFTESGYLRFVECVMQKGGLL